MKTGAHPPVRGTILVADDIPELLDVASRALRKLGYEVVEARDGEKARALACSSAPDLVVLDIMMPKMHGIDVLGAIVAGRAISRKM